MNTPVRHSLGLDGLWRVVGIGGITSIRTEDGGDPFFKIFAKRLAIQRRPSKSSFRLDADLCSRDIPLGELLDLYSGAIVGDNVVVDTCPPDLSEHLLDVDVSRTAIE